MPNANQNSGIDPNADQFLSMPDQAALNRHWSTLISIGNNFVFVVWSALIGIDQHLYMDSFGTDSRIDTTEITTLSNNVASLHIVCALSWEHFSQNSSGHHSGSTWQGIFFPPIGGFPPFWGDFECLKSAKKPYKFGPEKAISAFSTDCQNELCMKGEHWLDCATFSSGKYTWNVHPVVFYRATLQQGFY